MRRFAPALVLVGTLLVGMTAGVIFLPSPAAQVRIPSQVGEGVTITPMPFVNGAGNARGTVTVPASSTLRLTDAAVTAGSGTGVTVDDAGAVRRQVYKVTVSFTNVTSNATTHDLPIATLPAKTLLQWVLADLTTPYVCEDTCTTATLSMTVGSSAGGTQYLASFDADAAAGQFGDAQVELGASLAEATIATPAGALPSFAATSIVTVRLISAVGNLATGGVTNLSAGQVTFYLHTEELP